MPLLLLHLVLQIQFVAGVPYTSHASALAAPPPLPCLKDQESALLQLKRSFVTTDDYTTAFRSWRTGTDCCHWEGIACDEANGRVTSLDLGGCGLESGHLDPAVFELTSLRYLNLGGNDFNLSQLPSTGFERLTKLTDLNLSNTNLGGQVPHNIGQLTNLVFLDMSFSFDIVEIIGVGSEVGPYTLTEPEVQNFTALISNLASLRELRLGFVNLSQQADWCDALSNYTPNLRVLSLPHCQLSGTICASLSALQSLSVVDFRLNRLSGQFPDFLANLSFLTVLRLSHNHLEGWVPPSIFQHSKRLVTIDLINPSLSGSLPNFLADSSIQNLLVGMTSFSGTIPSTISNLKSLKKLGLDAPGFSGILPSSIGKLKSLNTLKVSGLDLVGPIPSWVANLTSLEELQFSQCGLYGSIPSSIGHLTRMQQFAIYQCKASGNIPPHITNLTQLRGLVLGSNNFTGTVQLSSLRLPNLEYLNLSNNKLIVVDGEDNSTTVSFPNMIHLRLASCSLTKFPSILRHPNGIGGLDLSNNNIHGSIPQWVWENLTNTGFFFLNLSHNELNNVGYDTFLPFFIVYLDLSFNMFEGPIPLPRDSGYVLDYSSNMFSSIPPNSSTQLALTNFFKASRNSISGSIPTSFCTYNIEYLDLSYNILSGSIPSCLMQDANALTILYLKDNQFDGELTQTIHESCTLEVIDISNNKVQGQLPRSLSACKSLEVLDIGNNEISDSFPCWMSALPRIQVLILKYNKFYGQVVVSAEEEIICKFASVRILDLSSNNFSGTLTEQWFMTLISMMVVEASNETSVMEYKDDVGHIFDISTAVTYKGSYIIVEKILRTLVFLDVSNNAFCGSIPTTIGELVLLHVVNMSHNSFTGPIPSLLGHLTQLEALDLSSNELSGEIPDTLTSLDSLTTLNVSDNNLAGKIPESPHFMTFTNSSFLGNGGLCGPPLSKLCNNVTTMNAVTHDSKKKHADFVLFLFVGLGFGIGFAIAIVLTWGIPIRKRSPEAQEASLSTTTY